MNPITAHHRLLMSTAELISEFEATVGCSTNHCSVIERYRRKRERCMLYVASHETTVGLTGNSVVESFRHRGESERLRETRI